MAPQFFLVLQERQVSEKAIRAGYRRDEQHKLAHVQCASPPRGWQQHDGDHLDDRRQHLDDEVEGAPANPADP